MVSHEGQLGAGEPLLRWRDDLIRLDKILKVGV